MGDFGREFINVTASDGGGAPIFSIMSGTVVPNTPPLPAPRDAVEEVQERQEVLWQSFVGLVRENTTRLQQALNALHAAGGGYVYFPPGRYYIGRSATAPTGPTQEAADVVFFPNITLRFAPGAVLVPMNFKSFHPERDDGRMPEVVDRTAERRWLEGRPDENYKVRIEIAGDIEADLRQIFDPLLDVTESAPREAGTILFTGAAFGEIYPEWWGAVTTLEAIATHVTRAFQAAIDAGHTNRRRPVRDENGRLRRLPGAGVPWRSLPTIPVVAVSSYVINATLEVGARGTVLGSGAVGPGEAMPPGGTGDRPTGGPIDPNITPPSEPPNLQLGTEPIVGPLAELLQPNPTPFVLVGDREVGNGGAGTPTLQPSSQVRFDGDALLRIEGVPSFSVRGIGLNAQRAAPRCLHVEQGGGSGHGEFEACFFLCETLTEGGNLLGRIQGLVRILGGAERSGPDTPHTFNTLTFTRCRLQPTRAEGAQPRLDGPAVLGVELIAGADLRVEFRNCFLTGYAAPMIRAVSGHFSLNDCTFHTRTFYHQPTEPAPGTAPPGDKDGTDVWIEDPTSEDIPQRLRGALQAPASFTAREVESQSFQLLAGFDLGGSASAPYAASAVTLINTHHTAISGDETIQGDDPRINMPGTRNWTRITDWATSFRPSIHWAGPGQHRGRLLVIGGRYRGKYDDFWQYVRGDSHTGSHGVRYPGAVVLAQGVEGLVYNLAVTTHHGQEEDRAVGHANPGMFHPVLLELPPIEIGSP